VNDCKTPVHDFVTPSTSTPVPGIDRAVVSHLHVYILELATDLLVLVFRNITKETKEVINMSQFVQRLANYLANEVLIKGLAHSRTFQRFAVRTDRSLNDLKKNGIDQATASFTSAVNPAEGAAAATARSGPPQPPVRGFPGFTSAFFKEIRKDLGL
jgi:hypothetical protein